MLRTRTRWVPKASATSALPSLAQPYSVSVVGDFDGDQRSEIVVHYEPRRKPGTVFDVIGR